MALMAPLPVVLKLPICVGVVKSPVASESSAIKRLLPDSAKPKAVKGIVILQSGATWVGKAPIRMYWSLSLPRNWFCIY